MSLEVLYGYPTGIKKEEIYALSTLVSRLTGVPLPVNKAIVGEMAFTHESGIHAHGVIREPATYESIRPEQIGRKRRIVLGKHSGSASVEAALHEMKYAPNEQQLKAIVARIKDLGDSGKRVSDCRSHGRCRHGACDGVQTYHQAPAVHRCLGEQHDPDCIGHARSERKGNDRRGNW